MNLIVRNLFGHMRSCLCKNNVNRFHHGYNSSANLSLIIHRRDFTSNYEGLLNRSVDNFSRCKRLHFGHNTVFTDSSRSLVNWKCYCTNPKKEVEQKPLSLFQKFKALYRDYWYVLVPVHCGTSVIWFGGFYYMAKSGVDIIPLLEQLRVSDKILDTFRSEKFEKAGYVALTFALYKLATPLRYAVTLGGTTVAINYLKKLGFIKPIPSNEKLKEMCMEQTQALIDRKNQLKDNVLKNKDSLIEKKNRWNNRVHKAFKNVGLPETDSSQGAAKRNVSRTKKDVDGQKGSDQK